MPLAQTHPDPRAFPSSAWEEIRQLLEPLKGRLIVTYEEPTYVEDAELWRFRVHALVEPAEFHKEMGGELVSIWQRHGVVLVPSVEEANA